MTLIYVTGYRYTAHLYCLAVQAGFYSNVVVFAKHAGEPGSIPVREERIFLHLLHLAPNVN